ncbi:hypothetical protein PVAND_008840 [Polypedilum vanderplanki]|uniref:Sodium/calcium exchanger membrane region domain-containing protein n=1 Tax=Polypedilum vanderplanki TaxID=319348 RepID=A0A9J6CAW5_POLVA|nr:hypothetical protein PVAND_008840 [Polypedilum vanderplanki]
MLLSWKIFIFGLFVIFNQLEIFCATDLSQNLTKNEKIQIQSANFHWLPYKKILEDETEHHPHVEECIDRPSSIDEFPKGIFTKKQLLHGLVILNILAAVYFFICLAFICEKYFLPSVERICKILKISPDVAATTFMATATTMPEFFTNTVSTFVAESDMGLSAIVGSTLFNTLGVAACASLFARQPIQIDWWPITRDSILFSMNVIILVLFAWDGIIMWWETCILMTLYVLYWTLMFQNKRIMNFVKNIVEERLMWCQRIKNYDIENQRPRETQSGIENSSYVESEISTNEVNEIKQTEEEEVENVFELWKLPENRTTLIIFWYIFTWPIRFLLHYTIPDPVKHKNLFPISFLMCVIWIGCTSYMVFWMVVIIGDTFEIPEPVMGLTFLAFGGCMPEAISAVIVARKGSGEMGVSNALGANSLAILFSLGIPWFITTMMNGAGWTGAHIHIYSYGMEYTIMVLILAVIVLYSILAFHGYKLRKIAGLYLFIAYFVFATFAVLMEFNVFLVGAPVDC